MLNFNTNTATMRDEIKQSILREIPCTTYLEKSKSYSANNHTGYCCPFCNSGHGNHGTGAVQYYPESNTFYCHACGKKGDVIDLYKEKTGSDYNGALSALAAEIGISVSTGRTAGRTYPAPNSQKTAETGAGDNLPTDDGKAPENANNKGTAGAADFSSYYDACRKRINDPAAISYLTARGISAETAIEYGIGYDPKADPANAPGAMGDEYRPHPAPRIIAPCTSSYYIARSIDPETPPAFKAMNPAQSKGGGNVTLFNAEEVNEPADVIFITEGLFDALSFLEIGESAIALNSKKNGRLLLNQLLDKNPAEYCAAFVIVPDNESDPKEDANTKKTAEELKADLLQRGYSAIVYNVAGEYHDANDALIANRDKFEKRTAAARHAALKEEPADETPDYMTEFLEKIQTEAYKPYRTGLAFFDELLGGGIVQQSLLLLMAAPGTGKTTLAQQIAETMAKERRPVLYLNFEMSREQMLAKAISARLYRRGCNKTAMQVLQGYNWTADDRATITDEITAYQREIYPYIRYNPDGYSGELNELLSFLKAAGDAATAKGEPAPAAIVDYLHLITSRDGLDTAELIKQAVKGLKEYAVKYNTFVFGIVATNRASNKDGKITMESGRDSSNLEYAADYQIALNYLAIDNGTVKTTDVEKIAKLQQESRRAMILRVLKSRFSQPGKSAQVMFDAAHNIFYGTDKLPAGYTLEPNAPTFPDKPKATMRI